jgi:hypothetical protein
LQNSAVGGLKDRLRTWFPDREFFMRSEGQVRFIKLSSRIQIIGASVVAALLLVWMLSMAGMAVSSYLASRDRLSLLHREATVAKSESRLEAYGDDIGKVA